MLYPVGGTWKKENELKALKAEVATLERKIQLTLAPPRQAEQNAGEQMQTDSKPDISPKPNAPNNAEGGVITDKDTERFMREHVVFAHIQPSVENQRSKGIKV